MKEIRVIKLLVSSLVLMLCVSHIYAIKKPNGKGYRTPKKHAVLAQRGSWQRPSSRQISATPVTRKVFYYRATSSRMSLKPEEILEQANRFVKKHNRWMDYYGNFNENILGLLTTKAILYGKLTNPTIEKLIKLRQSVMHTELQKESAMIARNAIEFVKTNGRIMRRNAENLEEAALALQVSKLREYGRWWDDPIFMEFQEVCGELLYKAEHEESIAYLEDFIAKEGHFPYSYNWDGGTDLSLLNLIPKEQEEALLFNTLNKLVMDDPDSEVAIRIRELWETYGEKK